uniref:Uncharacterized protein n=1 Tax=Arundo donax TaxID=35708 RepID=A0A0A8ZU88_ARUDO
MSSKPKFGSSSTSYQMLCNQVQQNLNESYCPF